MGDDFDLENDGIDINMHIYVDFNTQKEKGNCFLPIFHKKSILILNATCRAN